MPKQDTMTSEELVKLQEQILNWKQGRAALAAHVSEFIKADRQQLVERVRGMKKDIPTFHKWAGGKFFKTAMEIESHKTQYNIVTKPSKNYNAALEDVLSMLGED